MTVTSGTPTTLTLFCLPHAGGHAVAFREWQASLPAWVACVPLDLPGHGRRRAEPACTSWPALLDALTDSLAAPPPGPYALFGHSMGALVALELAHALRRIWQREPAWLGVAGCAAPATRVHDDAWLASSDDAMVAELRRLGGTPDALLAEREFLALTLPTLRADFHLCATYAGWRDTGRAPLQCAVLALAGRDDALLDEPDSLSTWSLETSGHFGSEIFDGGHFFVETQRHALLARIAEALRAVPMAERFARPPHASDIATPIGFQPV